MVVGWVLGCPKLKLELHAVAARHQDTRASIIPQTHSSDDCEVAHMDPVSLTPTW